MEGEETQGWEHPCSTSPARGRRKAERESMVITLDKRKRPLGTCTEKRARKLMEAKRAVIYRYYPFTIIIKDIDARKINAKDDILSDEKPSSRHDYRIKIDPGAKHTGITVVENNKVILFMQVGHHGEIVKKSLDKRLANRRNRRSRNTRYRRCKFKDIGKYQTSRRDGWLPPSQLSIVGNVITWVRRLIRLLGPCAISLEGAKFDAQLMEDPDIEGKGYQQGTLLGYEIKEYLKEKYHHTCQYCGGMTGDYRLEWEHKLPRSRGGSDSVKNATLACHTCNQDKGDLTPEEWLSDIDKKKHKTNLEEQRIKCLDIVCKGKYVGQGLRYAAWMNSQRWYIRDRLKNMQGVTDFEWSTGGRTAYNRHKLGLEKDHHLDALCVGRDIPDNGYKGTNQKVLYIKAMGRGTRFIGQCNACGIITTKYHDHKKTVNGLQTGDIVEAATPNGKYAGIHKGRIMVRSSGSHDIRCFDGTLVTGTKKSTYKVLQHADGYAYSYATKQ